MSNAEYTDEELQQWAEDLLETLEGIEEGVEAAIPKVKALLNDEISLEEYEEWVRANEELLEQMNY
jgi:hypothetical protein